MWVLLLPLGLGAALLPPAPPSVPPRRAPPEPSGGCGPCHSPHRGHAQANGTVGGSVTLGCPAGGAPLGRLLSVHWHFWGDPEGAGTLVCRQSRGPPRCDPRYSGRAALAPSPGPPGGLVLQRLSPADAGTYGCLVLGEGDCGCGEVTLLLAGAPCSPPCSRAPPGGGFTLGLLLLLLLPLPARGL